MTPWWWSKPASTLARWFRPVVSHEDTAERIDASDEGAGPIEKKLDELLKRVDALAKIVEPIAGDISTIKEMTGGWKAIGTVASFIKWTGALAGAIAMIVGVVIAATKAFAATIVRSVL